MDFIGKIRATILKHNMISEGASVLIGLSGGPDSVSLTTALHELAPLFRIKLHAVYLDHGLRPDETPAEIKFVTDLCLRLDIPLTVRPIDVLGLVEATGKNKQEAARELRYAVFEMLAMEIEADRIAVGHNLDDQVETFLMRILRGTGLTGLAGIPPVRGRIIRPLIETDRAHIEAFLNEGGLTYMTDSSNLKDDYTRNRMRSVLIPMMREFNPNISETLGHTSEIIRDEDQYIEVIVNKTMMRLITRKRAGMIELFVRPMESIDRVILRRILRRAVDATEGLRGIGFTNIEDIIRLIHAGNAGDRIYLPHDIRAIKKYSTLVLTCERPVTIGTYTAQADGDVVIAEGGAMLRFICADCAPALPQGQTMVAVFDADRASYPLAIRPRADGDAFHPSGSGIRKKLQDYFVDEKVPRDERGAVPIVTKGDDIVWVAGYRPDARFVADAETRRFLIVEYLPAEGK